METTWPKVFTPAELLRKNFSWIPGKQILNLELLPGGLWCHVLKAALPVPLCPLFIPASFWTISSLEKQKEGSEMAEKNHFFCPFIAQLCLMLQLPWHMEQLRAGWTSWDEDEPSLTWHWGFTNSSPFSISYLKTLFFSFKTQKSVQCWVIMRFLSMPFLPGLCDTANRVPTE